MSNKARNKVFAAILKLNKATTWEERKKVITSNRKALLSDVALQILEELISTASREQAPAQRLLERYRNLLVHARSEGIDAAFASCQEAVLEAVLALFEASTWDQAKIVVKQYQHELTSPLVKNVFVDLLKDHPSPASQRILLHHQALLESVRVKGIDAAFAEQLPSKGASPDDPVVQVVLAFLNAPTWDEAKTVLLESPVPLPPQQVGEIFDEISEDQPDIVPFVNGHRHVLSAVQDQGIETAFAQTLPLKSPANLDMLFDAAEHHLSEGHVESALVLSDQAVAATELLGLSDPLAASLSFRASIAESSGDIDVALELRARAALNWERAGERPSARVERLRRIGILLAGKQELPIAELLSELDNLAQYTDAALQALAFKVMILEKLERYEECLTILDMMSSLSSDTGNPVTIANDLVNRGIMFSRLDRLDEATNVYEKAEEVIPTIKESRIQGTLWHKIAYYHEHFTRDLSRSVNLYHKAEVSYGRAHNSVSQAEIWSKLGYLYRELNMIDRSYNYLVMAVKFFTEHNDLENLVWVQEGLGHLSLGEGDYEAAAGWLANAVATTEELVERGVLENNDLVDRCFQLFYALNLQKDYEGAQDLLDNLTDFARLADSPIDPHLQIVRAMLELKRSDIQAQINWDDLRENPLVQSAPTEVRSILVPPQNAEDIMRLHNTLIAFILNTQPAADRYDSLRAQNLLADHAVKVWQQGVSTTKGWRRSKISTGSLAPTPRPNRDITSDDADLKAVQELIHHYHQLGVWEDPNIAILGPIIDTYCSRTRFRGKSLINPQTLSDGCLHFFFYRSDPRRMLLGYSDSCVYVGSGHVVFCPLPFLEDFAGFVNVPDEEAERIRTALASYGDSDTGLDPNWVVAVIRARNAMMIEWVIAHEIGHADLDHPSQFLAPAPHSREYERAADEFFVENIASSGHAMELIQSLASVLATLYHQHYQDQFGTPYDGPDLVTTSVPITIQDSGGPHPPLLMRILDLADLLLEFYPDPDEVDYYHQVRQNITVEKDTV